MWSDTDINNESPVRNECNKPKGHATNIKVIGNSTSKNLVYKLEEIITTNVSTIALFNFINEVDSSWQIEFDKTSSDVFCTIMMNV